MQLETYISDLLYRYECVILPGFGAFLTQYQSAQLHTTTHAFYPPKKRLSFNAQLTDSDGLLANYISKTEMIPHEEASDRIKTYVRFLYDSLQKGESQVLKNIGNLSLDNEGRLQFEPSYHLNYLTNSFGLSSFTSPEILREVYKEEVIALEEKTPIVFTPERKASTSWLKYAAAAVIAFGLIGVLGVNYVKEVKAYNEVSYQDAKEQLEDKIQEATFVISNPLPSIKLTLTKPVGKYHIVAGAFREGENAQKRVNQLIDKGFKARAIGTNKYGLHQVVYGSYTDSQEALAQLRTIRQQDNKEAWLLVQELN